VGGIDNPCEGGRATGAEATDGVAFTACVGAEKEVVDGGNGWAATGGCTDSDMAREEGRSPPSSRTTWPKYPHLD
jgi:hypothetical protein